MKTIILSDIHLGNRHCNTELLTEVLRSEQCDRIILNGDTLDTVKVRKFTKKHWAIVDILRECKHLVIVRGNHDYDRNEEASESVLPALLNQHMMVREYHLDVGAKSFLVLHGDCFDPTLNYSIVADTAFFAYQVVTKINQKFAKWLKKKSKKIGGVVDHIRAQAVAYAREDSYSGVITGHTHYSEDCMVDDIRYMNCGSWTENPCSYIIADDHGVTLTDLETR